MSVENLATILEELAPVVGETQLPPFLAEKAAAGPFLQPLEFPRDRRARQAELVGGELERASFGHGLECAQRVDVELHNVTEFAIY